MLQNPVLELLAQGKQPKKIAEVVNWPQLTLEQREQLFSEAEAHLEEASTYKLLAAMYFLTSQTSPWDVIRVLTFVVRSSIVDYDKKSSTLGEIRQRLDKLSDNLVERPTLDSMLVNRWRLLDAEYYALCGMHQRAGNKIDDAILSFETATSRYQAVGAPERAAEAKNIAEELRNTRDQGLMLFPIQAMRDERVFLKQEIDRLKAEKASLEQIIKEIQKKITDENRQLKSIKAQSNAVEQQIQAYTECIKRGKANTLNGRCRTG